MKTSNPFGRRGGKSVAAAAFFVAGQLAGLSVARAEFVEPVRTTHGLAVYAGLAPAPVWEATHPDATARGGAPLARGSFYYIVSVFDQNTGARVEDAEVRGNVSLAGHPDSQSLNFDPIKINGATSYGALVAYSSTGRYRVQLQITRPGASDSARVEFVDDYTRIRH